MLDAAAIRDVSLACTVYSCLVNSQRVPSLLGDATLALKHGPDPFQPYGKIHILNADALTSALPTHDAPLLRYRVSSFRACRGTNQYSFGNAPQCFEAEFTVC